MRLALTILLVAIALPAQAHTPDELEDWQTDWTERVLSHGFSIGLAYEHADMVERHLWYFHPEPVRAPTEPQSVASQPRAPSRAIGSNVEQWRGLVAAYFPAGEVDRALCIMAHESGGNPNAKNPRSSAAGLWQFISSTWNWVAAEVAGPTYSTGAPYDPTTATRYAVWLWERDGWWHWAPYARGECR